MASVTVLTFPTAAGADEALARVHALQAQHLIVLRDAAIVSWPAGARRPTTKPLDALATTAPLGGRFWGHFFGLIFFTPLVGMAFGVTVGPLGATFREYGVDDDFIRRVRGAITAGTSALFLLTGDAAIEPLVEAVRRTTRDVLATNLTPDQERQLRDAVPHG